MHSTLTSDTTGLLSREAFCRALKDARERRGLSLDEIAETTKVCVSYYSALERSDVQRWPKGLFRRAFFRGYVTAVGLPVTEMVDAFTKLFPEDDRAPEEPVPAVQPAAADSAGRLALDISWHGTTSPIRLRLMLAALDASMVLLISVAITWLARASFGIVIAATSLTYFTLCTAVLGDRLALLNALRTRLGDRAGVEQTAPTEPADAPAERAWKSDARRVRPRDSAPRLRVRFRSSH